MAVNPKKYTLCTIMFQNGHAELYEHPFNVVKETKKFIYLADDFGVIPDKINKERINSIRIPGKSSWPEAEVYVEGEDISPRMLKLLKNAVIKGIWEEAKRGIQKILDL